MTDSDTDPNLGIDQGDCVPDVPDVSSALQKLQSEFGKKPKIHFFPPNFNVDCTKFFTFGTLGKILGKKAGGLGYDTCALHDNGDMDGMITGGPLYPEELGGKLESIDTEIDGLGEDLGNLQDQVDGMGDSAP